MNIFEIGEEQLSLRYRIRAEIAVLMCQPVVDPNLQITGGGEGEEIQTLR